MLQKIFFFFFITNLYGQQIPFGKPIFFDISIPRLIKKVDIILPYVFVENLFDSINPIIYKDHDYYFVELSIKNKSPIHFELINSSFKDGSEIYFIDLNTNGWVGPYTKKNFQYNSFIYSGQLKTTKIMVQYSMPHKGNPLNPIHSITIPKKLENIPIDKKSYRLPSDNILLCGYWPPSNEGIRHFSPNHLLNPDGWQGRNWENRGFDILSYFPYFDEPDCETCGQGHGDFEVDYQDTSEDWWNIVDSINPIAIITFSRGYIDYSWELEWQYFNYLHWVADFTAPHLPTPSPPDSTIPQNTPRYSTLPMEEIVSSIDSSHLGLYPYIDFTNGAGNYLSEFMGYHGVWYKSKMDSLNLPCIVAGHVHVGGLINWEIAREAVNITLREVIKKINHYQNLPGDINHDGVISVLDILQIIDYIFESSNLSEDQLNTADINKDNEIDLFDLILLSNIISEW